LVWLAKRHGSVVVTEKLNRAIVALPGGGLTITLGILNQEQAIGGIDFNTLVLLTGMMLIVVIACS
jgi:Na+/H+ antiporter NhaD/arsenite permease-like protein